MHRERWVRAKRQRALLSENGMSQLPTGVTGWRHRYRKASPAYADFLENGGQKAEFRFKKT
jgi:hypothetical protein